MLCYHIIHNFFREKSKTFRGQHLQGFTQLTVLNGKLCSPDFGLQGRLCTDLSGAELMYLFGILSQHLIP